MRTTAVPESACPTASLVLALLASLTLSIAAPTALAAAPAKAAQAATEEVPAAAKRAFEIADLYRAVRVGSPAVSSDGRFVVFDAGYTELETHESWSVLFRMAPDGSGLRPLTAGRHNDSTPAFSPDGKTIVFVSDRGDDSQLWVMPVDGGEPRQLTHFPLGVWDPLVSPDGRYIAVTSQVYPACGADPECNEKAAKAREDAKLAVHLADDLLYRHWTAWRDGTANHVLLVDIDSGEVVRDLTPGSWDSPTFSLGGRGYDFSSDGAELVYLSNHDPNPAESTNADLWRIILKDDSGELLEKMEPENLTAANPGWDGAPRYSPDGNGIAFLSQATAGYEADLYRLAFYDFAAGTTRYLTDRTSFDDWITEIVWTPNGRSLIFQADHHGRTPLYRLDVDGGKPELFHTHAYLDGWQLSADGRSVFYTRRSVGEPWEMFSVPVEGGETTRLTHLNADLEAEVDIRPAEEMWVEVEGGRKVHVFLVKPHGFDPARKYPLILNVHGGPQSQWADSFRGDWQVYPGKGYIVAFPNPTGSSGYGQDLVDGIACDWGGKVYDDLMAVTDALEKLPYVDPERLGAMGWSYGGYMMMWFEGHTTRFKAIAAMMGLFDLPSFYGATEELWFPEKDLCGTPWTSEDYVRWSPSRYVESFATPSLVITGEKDFRVPYTQSLQYFTALRKQGVPSRLVVFPNAGHWPAWYEMAFYYNAHLDWFHRFLGGEPAPWDVEAYARGEVFGKKKTETEQ